MTQIPDELNQKRKDGESFDEYKDRLKDGHEMVDYYLNSSVGETTEPSTRIIRRIKQGKRNVHALRQSERHHIANVIGFRRYKENRRQWENRLAEAVDSLEPDELTVRNLLEKQIEHEDSTSNDN